VQQFISFSSAHCKACLSQNVVFCATLLFEALSILVRSVGAATLSLSVSVVVLWAMLPEIKTFVRLYLF